MDERTPPSPPARRPAADPAPWRAAWDAPGPAGGGSAGRGPAGKGPVGRGAAGAGGGPVGGGPAGPGSPWRRILRTPRAAAGLGIGAAALLLWPFAGWSWWPWVAGAGALVLLRLLRLDGLLRGWVWHVAGLVVVAGLMLGTGPWAWAFAASIGVLLAGLVQLPLWRLAAVGAVLCAVTGTGFAITQFRTAEQLAAQRAQTQMENRGQLGAPRATALLPVLLTTVARAETGAVCDNLIAPQARPAFAAAAGAPDCAAAVRALAAQVTDPRVYAEGEAPGTRRGDELDVDACRLTWPGGAAPGPQLGRLTVGRAEAGTTYVVTGLRPC
ncbi:MAG: hypothetical protein ACT4RN_22680 [Pseudonocardia sp.]